MKPWLSMILVSGALLFVCSCVATGAKEAVNPELTTRLEAGKSTKADISTLLGAPTLVTYGAQGEETWNYYYVKEYPQGLDFLPLANALGPDFSQTTRVLTVAYDGQGVLQKFQRTRKAGWPQP